MKWVLIGFVKGWRRFISPLYGDVCRYYPTCSAYALEALRLYGSIRGSALAAKRICRCHPWAKGGFDPVPNSSLATELVEQGYITNTSATCRETTESVATDETRVFEVIA